MHEIWEALLQGVPFSLINILVFGFAIGIILERFYFMSTRYKVNSEEFMAQVKKLVQAGNVDRAVKLCEAAQLPLLEVVHAGLTRLNRSDEVAIAAMEEKMGEVVPALERRTPMLWTLANIATLIGLLGTIRGLIRAFGAVGSITEPARKTAFLSAGISEAMWNTFLGLLIAVICMVFHLFISNMTKSNKHDLERAVMQLENLLTLRRAGG